MDRIRIRGGRPLEGEIPISGAKNAALKLMAASLLTDETVTLDNVPRLADIDTLCRLLAQHGVEIETSLGRDAEGDTVTLTARNIGDTRAPYDLVRKMRASVLVLGPLLAREGHAEVSLPGGCAIGTRPVDMHLKGLEQLGAEVELKDGYILARAPKGLTGAEVVFPKVSVGATENLLMAATLARGETRLVNAAREPEVSDLGHCLIAMGAEIEGLGSDTLVVRGGGDRGPGQRHPGGARRRAAARRPPPGHGGPHRGRHLCHGRGHHRRRGPSARRAGRAPVERHRAAGRAAARSICAARGPSTCRASSSCWARPASPSKRPRPGFRSGRPMAA
jgi:UDP-N-acetylglucosamine 1-carboxyvinyltransferase